MKEEKKTVCVQERGGEEKTMNLSWESNDGVTELTARCLVLVFNVLQCCQSRGLLRINSFWRACHEQWNLLQLLKEEEEVTTSMLLS